MKKGFTLIELLVVVLIIGILSSIALPQYRKAVEKSRLAEAVLFIRNATQAIDWYLLENPDPSSDAIEENILITFPDSSYFNFSMGCEHPCWISATRENGSYWLYAENVDKPGVSPWTKTCYYRDSFGHEICKSLEANGYQVEGSL